jgi:hypothetical protein
MKDERAQNGFHSLLVPFYTSGGEIMIEKMRVMIMLVIIILLGELTTISGSLVFAQTNTTTTSSVRVEGFLAQDDLTATLTWGNTTLEKKVERGSTSVEFEIPKPNIRSNMTLMIQPDGLELSLSPTAMGYTPLKMTLGPKLVVVEALKVVVKEILVVLDLEIVVTPAKTVNKLTVDDESVAFAVETSGSSITVRPSSSLIIDPQKSVSLMVEGDDFKSTLVIRRGLSESEISVMGETTGNVKEVVVRARAAEVLAKQEVLLPLKLVNITMTLKDHGPIKVAFAKEEESKKEGTQVPVTTNQSFPQGGQTEGSSLMKGLMTLLRWKVLLLAAGAFSLCLAVAFNKKGLAVLAMALLALYFATTFIGGLGGGM